MSSDAANQEDVSQQSENIEYTEEEQKIADRTGYLIDLSNALVYVKAFGDSISEYSKMSPDRIVQEAGIRTVTTFDGFYRVLDRSNGVEGDDFRNIHGVHLWEIGGVNISETGINLIIPKEFGREGIGVVVTLQDIEDVRDNEFETISRIVKGEPTKTKVVQDIINTKRFFNGKRFSMAPIFKKENQE